MTKAFLEINKVQNQTNVNKYMVKLLSKRKKNRGIINTKFCMVFFLVIAEIWDLGEVLI